MHHLPDIPQDAFEQRLFELATDALVVCRVDGTIRRANPAAALLVLGDAGASVTGVLWEVVHPDDLAHVRSVFEQVGPDGSVHDEELRVRIVRPGGEVRWADVRAVVDQAAGLCHIVARDEPVARNERASAREILQALIDGAWALALPLLIIGGMKVGAFTPTEAAVVAAVYAFLVGAFVYRELKFRDVARIVTESAINSGLILLMIAASGIFSWLVANLDVDAALD